MADLYNTNRVLNQSGVEQERNGGEMVEGIHTCTSKVCLRYRFHGVELVAHRKMKRSIEDLLFWLLNLHHLIYKMKSHLVKLVISGYMWDLPLLWIGSTKTSQIDEDTKRYSFSCTCCQSAYLFPFTLFLQWEIDTILIYMSILPYLLWLWRLPCVCVRSPCQWGCPPDQCSE